MATVNIDDIGRDPLGYLNRVEKGETLVVTRDAQPVAEIKPISHPRRQPRPIGLCQGQFVLPTDFDRPLPDDVLRDFEQS